MPKIEEMTMEEVEARLAEINSELETRSEESELETLKAEVIELNARKAVIEKEAEQRKADEAKILEGVGTKIIEERKEDKKMEERTFAVDSAEYRDAWLKNLMGKELTVEERSAMTATDAIPTQTQNLIVNRLKENALLSKIDLMQIPGYVRIPVYATNGDAAWSTTNEQGDVIDHIDLTPFQLIKTVELPGTVDAMSIPAFEAYLVEALANKIESALQKAVIVGSGVSQPTGINVTHSTADGTFTKAAITKGDILKIMGKLDAKYQKDAVWIMPSKVFYEAMSNVDLPGFVSLSADLKPVICGKPVVLDDECVISSTDTIFYGGAKAYHMNLGKGVTVDKDASVGFKSNAVNYRAVCLADGKLDSTAAFVKYTRATS